MKHSFILLTFILLSLQSAFAQREVFFNELDVDNSEIKISSKVTGLDFNLDYMRLLPEKYLGLKMGSIESRVNFFHENRIANTLSLYKSVGLVNSAFNKMVIADFPDPSFGVDNHSDYKYQYELSLNLRIEPRWYFDYKYRHRNNKNVRNNSGWYLSLPISANTLLLHEPVNFDQDGWIPEQLTLTIKTPPTIGFRNAFSDRWFFEMNLGYLPFHFGVNGGRFFKSDTRQNSLFSASNFNSEIKVAFVF